jgi:hypothetical protein
MAPLQHDDVRWRVHWTVDKYTGAWTPEQVAAGDAEVALYERLEREGNLLLIGGASALFQYMLGNGTTTAAQALTYFNNANARIGVGDSTTAAADTQTALQAATNKLFKAMDATYPQHTDSTGTAGSKSVTFKSTFGTADANFAWQEWGIDNGTRLLNRKVESLGTKTSAATWALTITLSLA